MKTLWPRTSKAAQADAPITAEAEADVEIGE
ncbi:MAG: hypothetical protein JWP87_2208 [Labilithrix sp.]|nr:hypothetical protein [Labilithrix sp.]